MCVCVYVPPFVPIDVRESESMCMHVCERALDAASKPSNSVGEEKVNGATGLQFQRH